MILALQALRIDSLSALLLRIEKCSALFIMKKLILIFATIALFTIEITSSLSTRANRANSLPQVAIAHPAIQPAVEETHEISDEDFDNAVELIKRYESIHTVSHWPYIGYGHKVQKNEKYTRRNYSEQEAEKILRDDLRKVCDMFKDYGKDQLLLGVLAYSIGPYRLLGADGKISKSRLLQKLENGDRDIRDEYLSYCKYRGRTHKGLRDRRMEEFETFFPN